MSIHQVRELYDFAELAFDTSQDKLTELRKILLLHIRSSPNSRITIAGKDYTKNDVISILKKDYSNVKDEFDIYAVIKEHPRIAPIMKPDEIDGHYEPFSSELGFKIQIHRHKDWKEIQNFFNEYRFIEFFESVRKNVRELNFEKVDFQLSYLLFFGISQQSKCKVALKKLITSLLKKHQGDPEKIKFATKRSYYVLIMQIGNNDTRFLQTQYRLLHEIIYGFSTEQQEVFYKNQLKLKFPGFLRDLILKHQREFNERQSQNKQGAKSSKREPKKQPEIKQERHVQTRKEYYQDALLSLGSLAFLIGIIALIVWLFSGSDSDSDSDYDYVIPDYNNMPPPNFREPPGYNPSDFNTRTVDSAYIDSIYNIQY